MDIEDLFNENFVIEESKDDEPMVIPEFGPCSGDGAGEFGASSSKGGAGSCCSHGGKSLSCSTLQPCDCETKAKGSVLIP
jgi:hypothetical protein